MNLKKYIPLLLCITVLMGGLSACKNQDKLSKPGSHTPFVQKKLTPKEQEKLSAIFLDANRAKILGNFEEAIALFQQALAIDPANAAARYEIGRIYAANRNFSAALSYARDAYEIDPDNIWYARQLGELYSELGQLNNSIEIFRDIVKKHPDDYDNYFNLGSLLSAQGKYDDALALYAKLENRTGPSQEIALQRQMIYIDKGDYESALREINALIDQNPEELRLYGMKAEIYQKLKQPEEAKSIYVEMLSMEPDNGLVLLSLHDLERQAGNSDKAEEYLERAFGSTDLSVDVKVNILLNLLSASDFKQNKDRVLRLIDQMENANPLDAKTWSVAGDVYNNLGQLDTARVKFRKAVELDPNRPPIWQQILTIDSQLNDFDAMERESDKAVELFPQQPVFYLFNGIALLQQKKTREAIDALNLGKDLVVDNPKLLGQFFASLGDAYHEMNAHEDSDAAYDKALKYDPANVIVLNNYAYYLSLRDKDLTRAEQMAKKANDLSPDVASFQDTYAWVLYKNQNYQNAVFWVEQAMENGGGNDPEVLEHYGDILLKLNRRADAVAAWKKALKAGGPQEILEQKIGANSTE